MKRFKFLSIILLSISLLATGCQSNKTNELEKTIGEMQVKISNLEKERDDLKVQLTQAQDEKKELEKELKEIKKGEEVQQGDVTVRVNNKVNIDANPDKWVFNNRVEFDFSVVNHTDKTIQGIQGTLDIKDLFGVTILTINCDFVGQTISPGQTINRKDMGIDINEFMNDHVKLYNTRYEDLQFVYTVKKIVYVNSK